MRAKATGLLLVMAAVFVIVIVLWSDRGWAGYVRAGVEASLVGGLADWFAVTALFRHPMGLPIPHTAVIQARKDQFGETLGGFVQENFLTAEVIGTRLHTGNVVKRAAAWLSERRNAERVAAHLADAAVGLAGYFRDDDVHQVLEQEVARASESIPLAPLAGRALRFLTSSDQDGQLFDALVRGVDGFLNTNRASLRTQFVDGSPWWLPEAVDGRIFDRLFDGLCNVLAQANTSDHHELRDQFDAWLKDLADRLEHSPDAAIRAEQLEQALLEHPELRNWSAALWTNLKAALRSQADDADSELRHRLTGVFVATGRRLGNDPVLADRAERLLADAARYVTEHFQGEIVEMVSGTIARWDGEDTSRKLELLLGRDLQFIRINGTVVGGVAGLAIHGIAQVLG
jgi:uncharacterized membrane-anchored protein YjiN (DUF445 family)